MDFILPGPPGSSGPPGPPGPAGPIKIATRLDELPEFQKAQIKATESQIVLRELAVKPLLGLFALTVLVELFLSISAAFELINPSAIVLLAPAAVAVPQVPALLVIIFKWLFPSPE